MPLTLFIPDLARLAATAPRLAALETLLTRADVRPAPATGEYGVLAEIFGLPSLTAVAAFTRLADTGQRDEGFWFRADPVHLAADRDQLIMLPLATLEAQAEEAQALAGAFNQLYAADGYRLEAAQPSRWYLRVPKDLHCVTHDPERIAGGPVFDFMPAGADAARLKRLMNEIQMLFHEHPVNQVREASDRPLINTAWLWGGGRLPASNARVLQQVVTDMPLVRGLALFSGSDSDGWPVSADMLMRMQDGLLALRSDDVDSLATVEAKAAEPLLNALRRGSVRQLDIYPGGDRVYRVTRSMLYRFWRRRQPLSALQNRT